VVVGVVLVTLGLALLLSYLPSKRPLSERELSAVAAKSGKKVEEIRASQVSREVYLVGSVGAGAMLGFGLIIALFGALHRAEVETLCRACRRRVFAIRVSFGARCPACQSYAVINWPAVVGTAIFWIAALSLAIVLIAIVAG